jgi:dUTP pyrophosphatase
MKITKLRNVKTPERATEKAAGIDFFVPKDFPGSHFLAPSQSVVIPSGIKIKVPEGFALVAMNKSGVATKKGLTVGACLIDEDFEGEIKFHLVNTGDVIAEIKPGEKIVQLVLLKMNYEGVEVVESEEELFGSSDSARGESGFGSTGTK